MQNRAWNSGLVGASALELSEGEETPSNAYLMKKATMIPQTWVSWIGTIEDERQSITK